MHEVVGEVHAAQVGSQAHLVRPPEWVHLGDLELFELLAHAPSAVVRQRVAVLRKVSAMAGTAVRPGARALHGNHGPLCGGFFTLSADSV